MILRFFPVSGCEPHIHEDILEDQGLFTAQSYGSQPTPDEHAPVALASAITAMQHGSGRIRMFAVCCAFLLHAAAVWCCGLWLAPGVEGGVGQRSFILDITKIAASNTAMIGEPTDLLSAIRHSQEATNAWSRSAPPATSAASTPNRIAEAPRKNTLSQRPVQRPAPKTARLPEKTSPIPEMPQEASTATSDPVAGFSTEQSPGSTDSSPEGTHGPAMHSPGLSTADAGGTSKGVPGTGRGFFHFGTPDGPGIERLVRPSYPLQARRLGKEGTVILKLFLDAVGEVRQVEILQAAGFGMEDAAREAVRRSRFRPATMNGIPVACQAILPLHFKLE